MRTNKDHWPTGIPVCTGHTGTRLFLPAARPRRGIRISCLPQSSRLPPCVPQRPFPVTSSPKYVSPHFQKSAVTARTNLASHSCKCLGGDITGCDALAQARVVLVFKVYKQHPYLRLVSRRGPFEILAHRLLYCASTLQYEVGCWVLCK